uniref:Putative tail protein n=2 Tax=viral metagenome TaxID=1070528 RepID=A0A6M3IWJ5_9ZZZZ
MSVSSTLRKQQFPLDGATADYTFNFRALTSAPEDIKCYVTTNGTDTVLVYTTNYSVEINSDGIGGTVTLVSASTIGLGTLTVYRDTTLAQESDYDDYNQFPANTLEENLDQLMVIAQEHAEELDRAIKLPITYAITSSTGFLLPLPVAGKALKWNASADSLLNTDVDIDTAITAAATSATTALAAQVAAAASAAAAIANAGINANGYTSINAAVTAIGSTSTTLVVSDAQTLTASLTIPSTCTLRILQGGSIVKASSYTLTINGSFEAGLYQVFSGFSTGDVTFGADATEKAYPNWWGFATTATAAVNTLALQSAIDSQYRVHIPTGGYSFDGVSLRKYTYLTGDGIHNTSLSVTTGNTGLKIWGCTPPAWTDSFEGYVGDLDIAGVAYTTIGIDIYGADGASFHNIWCHTHNYGIKARTTLKLAFTGVIRLDGNNVGLKIPAYANDADALTQNLCANLWTFDLLNVRGNIKCGVSLGMAGFWNINAILGENNKVIFYALHQINNFTCGPLYQETAKTGENDRFGVARPWAFYMGKDEDGNTGTTGSYLVEFENVYTYSGSSCFHLANIYNVKIWTESGRGEIEIGDGVRYVESNSIGIDLMSQVQVINTRNISQGIYRKHTANLISNGNFAYPGIPAMYGDAGAAMDPTLVEITTATINSQVTRVLAVKLPAADTTYHFSFKIQNPVGAEFNNSDINLLASAQMYTNAPDVTSIIMKMKDSDGSVISTQTLTNDFASWKVLNVAGSINKYNAATVTYIEFTVERTTATLDKYLYINEIVAYPSDGLGCEIVYPSPFDILTGFTFTGTTSVDGGAGDEVVLRSVDFRILNGTTASTLKCSTTSLYAGDGNGPTDNIAKGATVGNFSLNASGNTLKLLNAGISGVPVAILATTIYENDCGAAITASLGISDSDIQVFIQNATTGALLDITTLVATGGIYLSVLYLTTGASYYVEFTHNYPIETYNVIASISENVDTHIWVVKAANTFRVYTTANGTDVTAFLIPKVAITP